MSEDFDLPPEMTAEFDLEFWERAYNLTKHSDDGLFAKMENWIPKIGTRQRPAFLTYIKQLTPDDNRGKKFQQCAMYMFHLMDKGALS